MDVSAHEPPSRPARPAHGHILVVDDETAILDFLVRGLEGQGYTVSSARDGAAGARLALHEDIDLVVLDRMLPVRGGLSVLADIRRERPTLPVVVLSARGDVNDRVDGLDRGATDYLAKPFSFRELLARVRTHLRAARPAEGLVLEAGGFRLDRLRRRVWHGEREMALSPREFELLAYFLDHPGYVLSRQQILSAVWRYDFDPGTNVVEVYVRYLRRKLDAAGAHGAIETIRSVGYRLRADD